MNISEEKFNQLDKNLQLSNENKFEFEILLKDRIDVDGFKRMLKKLKYNDEFNLVEKVNRKQLDIRTVGEDSSVRVSLYGDENILNYCKYNIINEDTNADIIYKNRPENIPSVFINEYNLRGNVSREDMVEDKSFKSSYINKLSNRDKFFRYKERWSFTTKDHKIDLTNVKSTPPPGMSKRLSTSKTLTSGIESFEVEIEALPYVEKNGASKIVLQNMLRTTGILLKANRNVDLLTTNTEQDEILREYLTLVNPELSKMSLDEVKQNPGRYYLRYQPVTLMKKNLLNKNLENATILEDYSVTEKADGERILLFVNKDKSVFKVDNKLKFVKLDIQHQKAGSTIIDGEYVEKGKLGVVLNMYLAFDIYFLNGEDVRNKNLIDRLQLVSDYIQKDKWNNNTKMSINAKTFLTEKSVFENTEEVFQKMLSLPYHTDGLIYTPIHLSPGALYKNDNSMDKFGGTWSKVFKWKPPEENSIDVLVRLGNESYIQTKEGGMQRCVYVDMFVAYKGNLEQNVNIMNIYDRLNKHKNKLILDVSSNVVKRFYDSTYLPVEYNNKNPFTSISKEIIVDDTIVEFSYNPDQTNSGYMKWVPMRVRKDKTALYKQSNKIENTANNYNTVTNVWHTIVDPVTKEMITGEVTLNDEEVKQDTKYVYYARDTPRHRYQSRPMLDFHNYWVKKHNLFDRFGSKSFDQSKKLLEIGCGQGGDLQKWIDNKFTVVVGVDNNEDNLLNSDHGIYKRMYESAHNEKSYKKLYVDKQSMLFLLLDAGEKWSKEYINSTENETLKTLSQIANGTIDKRRIDNGLMKQMHDVLNNGFNVISCQFAIHYFFENTKKLDAFCYNINKSLLPGGVFFGTALDGHIVASEFEKSNNGKLQGVMNDKVIWQIEKKYDYFLTNNKFDENLGKQIDVYVETINKVIPEFLIDFELLKRKLGEYKIRIKETGSFRELYDQLLVSGNKNWAAISAIEGMTDELKRYSFMNRWFVFEKDI